jgi:hypothetical protein
MTLDARAERGEACHVDEQMDPVAVEELVGDRRQEESRRQFAEGAEPGGHESETVDRPPFGSVGQHVDDRKRNDIRCDQGERPRRKIDRGFFGRNGHGAGLESAVVGIVHI